MTGRVIWPPRRARSAGSTLQNLRRRPDVRAEAHLLFQHWQQHRSGSSHHDDLTTMLSNAIDLAALRALLNAHS